MILRKSCPRTAKGFGGAGAQGLEHVQLAFEKSFTDYDFTTGHYSTGFAHKISRELAARGLHVAVLGCYINPVPPDADARAAQTQYEAMRQAIRKAISQSSTERDFVRVLRQQGFLWRREEGHKYATSRSGTSPAATLATARKSAKSKPPVERVVLILRGFQQRTFFGQTRAPARQQLTSTQSPPPRWRV